MKTSHIKLTKMITWITVLCNKLWAVPCRATQTDGSWWKVLTKHGPLEKGMVNHFSILGFENPSKSMKRQKIWHWKWTPPHPGLVAVHYSTGEEQRNSSRRNESAKPKLKWCLPVDVSGGESKVQCCTEQYCIGTWNVRSMNQGKLEVIKQEMARVNTDILRISEIKWTRRVNLTQMIIISNTVARIL